MLAAAGCAAPAVEPAGGIAVLAEAPQRPYERISFVEARGAPGASVRLVYDELREEARALGADAVIKLEERKLTAAAPAPYDPPDRPLLGNAYPGPLGVFDPGAFPPAGEGVKTRGTYYEVEGIAIRYLQ